MTDVLIRPARPSDAADLNEMRRMPGVFENILGLPSEKLSRSEKFLTDTPPNVHLFVAETETTSGKKVVGMIGLTIAENPRCRHCASIGLMVSAAYQGQGIGKQLMRQAVELADNWLILQRLELTVFIDNERAIQLYKSFGFEIEGVKRKAAVRNGELVDEYLMARLREVQ